MKYVNFLFHIYQPPIQHDSIIASIVDESYEPLTRQFTRFPDLKLTLNINYSLAEQLKYLSPQVLDNIRTAYQTGSLELTATGAYHPIFPLIPEAEVEKQIELNRRGMQQVVSSSYGPEGVFPPELAFNGHLVSLFKRMGFKWTLADDSNLYHYGTEVPYDRVYTFDGLPVLLRSNLWSNKFARRTGWWRDGKDFVEDLTAELVQWQGEGDGYVIIALDGETFGHHHKDLDEQFLSGMFDALRTARKSIQTMHLADICRQFRHEPQFIPPGSWSTDLPDIRNRDFFSWWKSRHNRVHLLQWQLLNLVLDKVRRLNDTGINDKMDKALYSCQFWWAGYWKFEPNKEPGEVVYKGAFNLMQILQEAAALMANPDEHPEEHLQDGEKILRELITEIQKKAHGAED